MISLSRNLNVLQKIEGLLKDAKKGASKIITSHYAIKISGGLGLVFIVPHIKSGRSGEKEELTEKFLDKLKGIDADITVFFSEPNPDKLDEKNENFLGVAIVGNFIHLRNSRILR